MNLKTFNFTIKDWLTDKVKISFTFRCADEAALFRYSLSQDKAPKL